MSRKAMQNINAREAILKRDEQAVKSARRKLMDEGMAGRAALKKIKKVITKSVKEKQI